MSERRRTLLLDLLDQAFNRRAWHGTGLWGSIRGLTHRDDISSRSLAQVMAKICQPDRGGIRQVIRSGVTELVEAGPDRCL